MGRCSSGVLSWWGFVLVGSGPDGELSWGSHPGGVVLVGFVLVGNCPRRELSWWEVVLVRVILGSCPCGE